MTLDQAEVLVQELAQAFSKRVTPQQVDIYTREVQPFLVRAGAEMIRRCILGEERWPSVATLLKYRLDMEGAPNADAYTKPGQDRPYTPAELEERQRKAARALAFHEWYITRSDEECERIRAAMNEHGSAIKWRLFDEWQQRESLVSLPPDPERERLYDTTFAERSVRA